MVLIGYHSTDAYKLYSPNEDKLMINRDVQVDESNRWNWTQKSVQNEQDTIRTVLKDDQKNEEITAQNEGTFEQNVRRSTRTRTKSVRLTDSERFPDQAIDVKADLIEETMITKSKPIDLTQVMNYSNWLEAMQKELKYIERNKNQEFMARSSKKPIYAKWVYKLKLRQNGEIAKHKAKLVAKGFL